ncbi:MAG: sulfatase [Planctomycetaceae bacterium]|nr:sulfatase [Planctomycetaceae bacterium]
MNRLLLAALVLLLAGCSDAPAPSGSRRPPNIVVILMDDMGYADIGAFGAKAYPTPNLDRLAREGRVFTDFYVSQAVCSASRSALLTGCYNPRIGIYGALFPNSKVGISSDETTLAQLCKQKNYATAIYGKWHLGDHRQFLPLQHGFDEYFGLPYSNDMWPQNPISKNMPDLPLIEGNQVVKPAVSHQDQEQLTTWYTEHAVSFIERNRERPFFLYVPHSMVHVPLHVSDRFRGKSGAGLYGDVMMEVDWSVGEIVGAIRKQGLERDTLLLFTSDNGPWLIFGDHAGSAGPLREGKGTMFDGGCRESTIFWGPGRVPAGTVCREPAMTIDVLPTVAAMIGASLPARKIDGRDISPLVTGAEGARSPHEAYYFYWGQELQAVRSGRWKLHFAHGYSTLNGRKGGTGGTPVKAEQARIERSLFDLEADPGERTDVKEAHADVVARLESLADGMRRELGDSATKTRGAGMREPGRLAP